MNSKLYSRSVYAGLTSIATAGLVAIFVYLTAPFALQMATEPGREWAVVQAVLLFGGVVLTMTGLVVSYLFKPAE